MFITCQELIGFLHDYRTGALPAERRAVFEEHLAVCAPCIDYLESYDRTVQLELHCRHSPEEAAPPEVPKELIEAILAAQRRAKSG